MKMNPSALREILIKIEDVPAGQPIACSKIEGLNKEDTMEHVQLLLDGGFIEGEVIRDYKGVPLKYKVIRMTLAGHQFLDKARNDTLWKKALEAAKEKGLSTSLNIIVGFLESIAKKHAGLE